MDIEKTMQFLLEQQARFDARQAEFVVRHAQFEVQINEILLRVASAQERTSAILSISARTIILNTSRFGARSMTRGRYTCG
ncbi:MAG: hypothetical protein WAU45_20015 [Blastocatellia bacterium]